MVQKINFPEYQFRFKNNENKTLIFDIVRKIFVTLTPEEWVRQHVLHFLISELKYPLSMINVEKQLLVHNTKKRYDIVVYNPDASIHLVVECKAPAIPIDQGVFDQNGLKHYYCKIDYLKERYIFLKEAPQYSGLD